MRNIIVLIGTMGLIALALCVSSCGDQAQKPAQGTTQNSAQLSGQEQQVKADASTCATTPVTTDRPANPNTALWSRTWYRSPDGQIWASSPGLSDLVPDGDKVLWAKPNGSDLHTEGHRLEGDAAPLRVVMPAGYEDEDYQASSVTFSAPGCWQITAWATGGTSKGTKWTFVVYIPALNN